MPTYYLLRSGALEKRGLKFEEFAVPSGNLTMQQMVARQVDLGTYAGPSFILGHDKGGMIGIAVIEHVGRTTRIMARKDLAIGKVEQLKGLKIANQTGSSIGNIFVDQIAPAAGLNKGDYQEVRMDVNNMVAAHVRQDRRRHGQRRALQLNCRGRWARHHHHGLLERGHDAGVHGCYSGVCCQERRRHRRLSQGVASTWRATSRSAQTAWPTPSTASTPPRATPCRRDVLRKALATIDVDPGFPC